MTELLFFLPKCPQASQLAWLGSSWSQKLQGSGFSDGGHRIEEATCAQVLVLSFAHSMILII